MNKEMKSKKTAVMMFCAVAVLMYFGCQTTLIIEETINRTDFYDYQAKQYDPAIMRFSMVDPVDEKYPSISPYAHAGRSVSIKN